MSELSSFKSVNNRETKGDSSNVSKSVRTVSVDSSTQSSSTAAWPISRRTKTQPSKSSSVPNDDVIYLLDSSSDDDDDYGDGNSSDNVVAIVEPQPASKQRMRSIDSANVSKLQTATLKKSSEFTSKCSLLKESIRCLDDSSDDDDSFLTSNKPSGLLTRSTSTKSPLNTNILGIPTQEKETQAKSAPLSITSPPGDTPHNPCVKKKKTPSSSGSGQTADWMAGSTSHGKQNTCRNPYLKEQTPTSASSASVNAIQSPGVTYPKLRHGTQLHKDIRANILLALWKFARSRLVQDSYNHTRLETFMDRLVELAITARDYPIRSLGEYAFRPRKPRLGQKTGCMNQDTYKRLKEDLESTFELNRDIPVDVCNLSRKYFTICEACLIVLREHIVKRWKQQQQQQQHNQNEQHLSFPKSDEEQTQIFSKKENWISLSEIIPKIDARLRPECPARLGRSQDDDNGAAHYMNRTTRSAEFRQIEKLMMKKEDMVEGGVVRSLGMSYLKGHKIKGEQFFELTPLGYQKARMIRSRTFPAPVGHLRSSNLEFVHPKFDKVCLAVDIREGGGTAGSKVLHEMCNTLDSIKIPYFVGHLSIGDYCFFSGNQLCPILVERKSVQDVAQSIHDGRWFSQKHRMYHGQFVFGYDNCRMAFIIEGKLEKQQVTGGYVASAKFNVTKERFDEAISNLEAEGFDVLRTTSTENSMFQLGRWAEQVAAEVQSGKLKLKLSYNEFMDEMKKIPPQTDFSRLARYNASSKRKAATERRDKESTISLLEIDSDDSENDHFDDDTGGVKGVLPNKLDDRFAQKRRPHESVPESNPKRSKDDHKSEESEQYKSWTVSKLQSMCVQLGLPKSGSKEEIIKRLCEPRPPAVYVHRKKEGLYVPARLDAGPTALLVALQILQDLASAGQNYIGATKEEVYTLAESLEITKNPFSGGATQTGPFHYDGWSNMGKLLESGDPPLVICKKRRYRLSTTSDISGIELARGMHKWCHEAKHCRCQDLGYIYNL